MFACLHLPEHPEPLLEVAASFSPWIEETAADTAVFSIEGLGALFGTTEEIAQSIYRRAVEEGSEPYVAVASNPDTAVLAAHHFPNVTIIPPGQELSFLGLLPLDALPLDPKVYEVLTEWGVRTVRDLARLPEDGVHERLGPAAVYWQRLGAGKAQRPLRPRLDPTSYERRQDLDHPIELLEPLLFLVGRFLNELCGELDRATISAGVVHVKLETEAGGYTRVLQLPFPTRDRKFLLKLVQHDLEAHPAPAAITAVAMAITPVRSRKIQHGLFAPPAPEPERLSLTLDKIRAMVGRDNVGAPELLDTWRPEGWELREVDHSPAFTLSPGMTLQAAFRYFRPPRPARVEFVGGAPQRIVAQGVSGRVLRYAGPWRSSGDWWRSTVWDRDEWDVLIGSSKASAETGALYRLYQDRPTRGWFLEGEYD
jgi:protein ImuB